MRRTFTLAALVLAASLYPAPRTSPVATASTVICPSPSQPSVAYVRYTLIPCAVSHWTPKLDVYTARNSWCAGLYPPLHSGLYSAEYVACKESGWHWNSYNASGCAGIYQYTYSTWESVRAMYPKIAAQTVDSRFNARSEALLTARFTHDHGWYPWR